MGEKGETLPIQMLLDLITKIQSVFGFAAIFELGAMSSHT